MPAAAAAPDRLPGQLADLTGPLDDLRTLLREHPELADPLSAVDADTDDPAPAGPEVLKAGFWDRAGGDGGGFAAGGAADNLPPGPVLAGFAADVWADGLARVSDDELIGVLRAARRLASWATALELAAAGDLWRRRVSEEEAGDTGAAARLDAEIAAALTLTGRAAGRVLDLAVALRRLPATSRALAAGDIDVPRATVIANEVTGLTGQHAAAVERAVIGAAPGMTTGQLGAATHRAVIAADPTAARRRKERALRDARVERWDEYSGTAALAGRDLPPAEVLAADHNLTALAKQLKAAGTPGTLDMLRARVYLALLTGAPVTSLLPASPGGATRPDDDGSARPGFAHSAHPGFSPGAHPEFAHSAHSAFASPGVAGAVNLTLPLATWLGLSDDPGHCAGYGPLDAADSRDLAAALASRAGNKWCLTITDAGGNPVLHGCSRTGPSPGRRRGRSAAGPRDGSTAEPRDGSAAGARDGPARDGPTRDRPARDRPTRDRPARDGPTRDGPAHDGPARDRPARDGPTRDGPAHDGPTRDGPARDGPARDGPTAVTRHRPAAGDRDRPPAGSSGETWTFTLTSLTGGDCDHSWETPAYRPSPALRHLIEIRHATCVFPGCRRPAVQCDADHTIAYQRGGRTCLCNLAPLCRHHHEAKQTPGWRLEQPTPGKLIWTTPSGRRYRVP